MRSWWQRLTKLYRDARETWRLLRHANVYEQVQAPVGKGRPTVVRRVAMPPVHQRVRVWSLDGKQQSIAYEGDDTEVAKKAFRWLKHEGLRRATLEQKVGERWEPRDEFDPATAYVDPLA